MREKHEMNDQEYRVYQQQHPYDDVIGTEEAKIQREKRGAVEHRRRSTRRIQQVLGSLNTPEAVDEAEEDLELPEEEQVAKRLVRNARTHKHRLISLRKRESQDE